MAGPFYVYFDYLNQDPLVNDFELGLIIGRCGIEDFCRLNDDHAQVISFDTEADAAMFCLAAPFETLGREEFERRAEETSRVEMMQWLALEGQLGIRSDYILAQRRAVRAVIEKARLSSELIALCKSSPATDDNEHLGDDDD